MIAVAQPPDFEEEGMDDWDEMLSRFDDRVWSHFVFVSPFSWQLFLNWWVARRYVQPRDPSRR